MRLTSLIAVLVLAVVACRSDDNNNPNPDSNGSNNGSGGVTIQQVQDDAMAAGTAVSLYGVVITAIDSFGDKTGDIWVEEPGGGKRSGVHVYKATGYSGMAVGDTINLTNSIKYEFALMGSNADPTGRTETELEPASSGSTVTLTKVSSGATITPDKVDALAIGQMYDSTMAAAGGGSAFTNAWEDWEGVLVELDNVDATAKATSFGSATPVPADNWAFTITGVAKAEGSMTDVSTVTRGTCFSNVTGVISYFYDYLIYPRSASDLAAGGTSCPLAETSCSDNIDNDGNGFTDCADNGCIISASTCRSAVTINALDTAADASPATPTVPAAVGLTGRCVTAVKGNNFYIADAGTAAADGGLFVFGGAPTGLAAGNTVDVIGTTSLFKQSSSTATEPQLEINGLQVTKDAASCTVVPAVPGLTAAQLTADATGHKWIGSLITITGAGATGQFKVTTAQTTANKFFGTLTQNGTNFQFGGTFVQDNDPAATTCYTSITGIWTYDTTGAGSYEILPTVAPTAVTCL